MAAHFPYLRFEELFSELINDRDAIAAFSESFVRLFSKWQQYETRGGPHSV
jgi:hypothetical protein